MSQDTKWIDAGSWQDLGRRAAVLADESKDAALATFDGDADPEARRQWRELCRKALDSGKEALPRVLDELRREECEKAQPPILWTSRDEVAKVVRDSWGTGFAKLALRPQGRLSQSVWKEWDCRIRSAEGSAGRIDLDCSECFGLLYGPDAKDVTDALKASIHGKFKPLVRVGLDREQLGGLFEEVRFPQGHSRAWYWIRRRLFRLTNRGRARLFIEDLKLPHAPPYKNIAWLLEYYSESLQRQERLREKRNRLQREYEAMRQKVTSVRSTIDTVQAGEHLVCTAAARVLELEKDVRRIAAGVAALEETMASLQRETATLQEAGRADRLNGSTAEHQ